LQVEYGKGTEMKKLTLVVLTALLSGCAGLNVAWVATASYNAPAVTRAELATGVK
jgi:hypothetical protein